MSSGINYNNKDILFKVLSQHYQNKSLAVYGLDVPKIKQLLPSSYPVVTATETHADTVFLLEDETSVLILEYESSPRMTDFLKYSKYVVNTLERLYSEGYNIENVIVAVIYTGDIKSAPSEFNVGSLCIQVKQVFLSRFNTDEIYTGIKIRLDNGQTLTDDEIMKLIILPLTQPDKILKQKLIEDTIDLAKQIKDEMQQLTVMAGIITATDKFIDRDYLKLIREWMKLTKFAKLIEEEKYEAINETRREEREQFALAMLVDGDDLGKIMKYTKLTRDEIESLRSSIGA